MVGIGIRREDKSRWEARVPLVPDDIRWLVREKGLAFTVQTSPIRAFKEDAYRGAGAAIADRLDDCRVIMGVKEIPPECFAPGRTYVFFSHTIKGQPGNMPMLRRLMELKCQLIDYEKIVDSQGRRMVFFGRFAGLAGMIDSMWALGCRLDAEGVRNPFTRIQQAYKYRDLDHARTEFHLLAEDIRRGGIPQAVQPFVCGFAGYGKVSQGAQEIFDLLPFVEVAPADLPSLKPSASECYKVVFREQHMVERIDRDSGFDLTEYYRHPELYRPVFYGSARHLTMLINCIYWEPKYPRLIDREQFRDLYRCVQVPRLRVVGDISCDIDGSVACTVKATEPANPVFVYDPETALACDGVEGPGPVVLAVDFLPCEVPVDASIEFSRALSPFVPALAGANYDARFVDSGLPRELRDATILWQGELTGQYKYLSDFINR